MLMGFHVFKKIQPLDCQLCSTPIKLTHWFQSGDFAYRISRWQGTCHKLWRACLADDGALGSSAKLAALFKMAPEKGILRTLFHGFSISHQLFTIQGWINPAEDAETQLTWWGSAGTPQPHDLCSARSHFAYQTCNVFSLLRVSSSLSCSPPLFISLFVLEKRELTVQASHRMLWAAACNHLLFPLRQKGLIL